MPVSHCPFLFPSEILRLIQLDLDLKFKTNIRELFEEFDSFLPGAIIGLAREMQPVYRCVMTAGGPPPRPSPPSTLSVLPPMADGALLASHPSALGVSGTHLCLLLAVDSMGRWVCPKP